MGEITIKHLAEKLSLSTATISKALQDSHEISAATKNRVLSLANLLNYRPNPFASGLRQHKSKTIAVILPEIADNFFAQAINGIEEIAREKGYHLLIYITHESSEREAFFVNDLLSRHVDGALISLSNDTADFSHLDKLQKMLPTVFFDRTYDGSLLHVTNNDYESCFNATEHLIQSGCKRIGFLSALQNLKTGHQRLNGYADALAQYFIPFDDALVVNSDNCKNGNYSAIKRLLLNSRPDGLVSSVEKLVKVCYSICDELKLHIPGDLKIISFSNLDTASLLQPPLSTITQHAFEIGGEAATMLLRVLKNSNYQPDNKVIDAVLVKRHSTFDEVYNLIPV